MNPIRKALVGGGLVAATMVGGAIGASFTGTASAATSTSTPSSSAPGPSMDPRVGGHAANGITETLLTGDTADKARAAALAAIPGGTVQRVENDAEGAVYEAHMLDANGNPVTVKMDGNFNVTGTETGGPHGGGRGGAPAAAETAA